MDRITLKRLISRSLTLSVICITATVSPAYAEHGDETGSSYLTLDAGFTQDLVGTAASFMGDIAFASDGDIFVSPCVGSGGSLRRFDLQDTVPLINGTTSLHPVTTVLSNAGCGLINHPDGFIYSNTSIGITQINATTGAATGLVFGSGGNALGIAVHPDNGDIIHMSSIQQVLRTPVGGASAVYSTANNGNFVDEIVFDPSGLLYLATRAGGFRVTVINPDGTLNRNIPLTLEPDGMAFHATDGFMLAMNLNGTITKIDFNDSDATSEFANGGFRHDMSTVGLDGCLYNTQSGTRFDNGTTNGANSVVRICSGFVPQTPGGGDSIDVAKVWTHTDVCFEEDNDGDGQISEDPVDSIDNDNDGLTDEDAVECEYGTSSGTLIDTVNGTYTVESVIKPNGKVASYNPGQLYAVTTVNVLGAITSLQISENYDDCTGGSDDLLDLNPRKGGGRAVVVIEHGDGTLEQVFNANTDDPNVVFTSDEDATHVTLNHSFNAGDVVRLYVKFRPSKQSSGDGSCVNLAGAEDDAGFVVDVEAALNVIPKVNN